MWKRRGGNGRGGGGEEREAVGGGRDGRDSHRYTVGGRAKRIHTIKVGERQREDKAGAEAERDTYPSAHLHMLRPLDEGLAANVVGCGADVFGGRRRKGARRRGREGGHLPVLLTGRCAYLLKRFCVGRGGVRFHLGLLGVGVGGWGKEWGIMHGGVRARRWWSGTQGLCTG